MKKPESVDEYISQFEGVAAKQLSEIRETIRKAAPKAEEKISYGMPAYALKGVLIYFAAHKNHIGVYPYPSAMTAFSSELSKYKRAKGSIHFPYNEPIPLKLLAEIVKFRVAENEMKAELKKAAKKKKG